MACHLPNLQPPDIVYDLIRELIGQLKSVSLSQIDKINQYISGIFDYLIEEEFYEFKQFLSATKSKLRKEEKDQMNKTKIEIENRIS